MTAARGKRFLVASFVTVGPHMADVTRNEFAVSDAANTKYLPVAVSLDGAKTFLPFLIQGEIFPAVTILGRDRLETAIYFELPAEAGDLLLRFRERQIASIPQTGERSESSASGGQQTPVILVSQIGSLRAEPSADAPVVGQVARGTELRIVEMRPGWAHVVPVNGLQGWLDEKDFGRRVSSDAGDCVEMGLREALSVGAIVGGFRGTGGSSGDAVVFQGRAALPIAVCPVWTSPLKLENSNAAGQSMVVTKLRGIPRGELIEPKTRLRFDPARDTEYVFEAYCLDFRKDNPSGSDHLRFSDGVPPDVAKVLAAGSGDVHALQLAVWAVTDNTSASDARQKFSATDKDLLAARAVVVAAGLPAERYRLFASLPPTEPANAGRTPETTAGNRRPEARTDTLVVRGVRLEPTGAPTVTERVANRMGPPGSQLTAPVGYKLVIVTFSARVGSTTDFSTADFEAKIPEQNTNRTFQPEGIATVVPTEPPTELWAFLRGPSGLRAAWVSTQLSPRLDTLRLAFILPKSTGAFLLCEAARSGTGPVQRCLTIAAPDTTSPEPSAAQRRKAADEIANPTAPHEARNCDAIGAHTKGVASFAVSPNGQLLASGSYDHTVKLWSLQDARLISSLDGHAGWVRALVMSPDGRLLASGSDDGTVKLWSLPDGRQLTTLVGHTDWVLELAVSPDGKVLVSTGIDGTIRLWSLPEGRHLALLNVHKKSVWSLAVSPDGTLVASGGVDGTLGLSSLSERRLLRVVQGHTDRIWAIWISADSRLLATGSEDGQVKLWSLPTGSPIATLEGHRSRVRGLFATRDGRTLVSAGDDAIIKFWSLPEGRLVATLKGHTDDILAVAISSDLDTLASASRDHTIKLWSLADGTLRRTLAVPGDGVYPLAIAAVTKILISAQGKSIRLWSLPDGEPRGCLGELPVSTPRRDQ
ncbi:MAG: hypothetical protein A3H96_20560 [Acidobacteria bacterium RIFCSPLOWO2_02_FULL_67_36]|nr:MAG: hypothetical protein A3H96_20560 [Acidobacteria bacterium RIFCSPLOWO2_02_FULL_67_36]OFW24597.1 MAG: hypothetical protein A3G21_18780 [Acidobacteria bacterium RIFCSPLOWO2_12_FULL_66_21]